jgi:ferredoxin
MNFTQYQTSDRIRTMADRTDKNTLNVPGKYYNDLSCIDCDLCREIAPQIFTRDNDEGLSYVWKQPVTHEEIVAAEEARRSCPTETIGDDG